VEGVVINKKLFQRAKKDKNAKVREKRNWKSWKRSTRRSGRFERAVAEQAANPAEGPRFGGVSNNFGEMQIAKRQV